MWIGHPGVDGIITDQPAHQLEAHQLAAAQDAIKPFGLVRQRRGWAYVGTVADVADNLVACARVKFFLNANTRDWTCDDDGDTFSHNPSGAGTALTDLGQDYLPRAVYGDELLLCARDGIKPLRRWSGATAGATVSSGTFTYTAGQATLSGGTLTGAPQPGSFTLVETTATNGYHARILSGTTSSITLQNVLAGITVGVENPVVSVYGLAFPAVSVYKDGSMSQSSTTVTGFGTKWNTASAYSYQQYDHLFPIPADGSDVYVTVINSIASDTSLSVFIGNTLGKGAYHIGRQLPFKDVATHKGSLYGTGVAQHKTRVYVGPAGWDISFPPGFPLPHDPASAAPQSDDILDFFMDFIDIPTPDDDDEMVAILSSDNPLVALGRADAWGVYGPHGDLEVNKLPNGDGAGCIDIRSAWNLSLGPVWASDQGVLAYVGGQVVDLTENRINREWRELIDSFDFAVTDYCTIGEADGILVVSITVDAGSTFRSWNVYPFDDRGRLNPSWQSRLTNVKPRFMFSARVPGEKEALLAVSDAQQGRILDYMPMLDGTGIARDGDGTSPALQLDFPLNLPRLAGADVEERMLELVVEANLLDSAGAGSTLGGTVLSGQRPNDATAISTNLNSMDSKAGNVFKPYKHKIGVKAGLHQVKLAKSATQTTETFTEVSRLGFSTRRSRRPI